MARRGLYNSSICGPLCPTYDESGLEAAWVGIQSGLGEGEIDRLGGMPRRGLSSLKMRGTELVGNQADY